MKYKDFLIKWSSQLVEFRGFYYFRQNDAWSGVFRISKVKIPM